MGYVLIFRKNNFVGLYNMTTKTQLFNITIAGLPARLALEFGTATMTDIQIIVEGEGQLNILDLPTLREYTQNLI